MTFTIQPSEGENLDGFPDAEELSVHLSEVAFTAPAAYLNYGFEKRNAMKARLAGDIEAARGHERECDRLYHQIPGAWKW